MINDACTNKNCSYKVASTAAKKSASPKSSKTTKQAKTTRTRKSTKCITYNINDLKEKENEEESSD